MTPFQLIAIPVLLLLAVREAVAMKVRGGRRRFRIVRAVILLAAAAAIWEPSLLSRLARLLGIGRGTDLLLYLFLMTFIGVSFALYARCQKLERQIVALAREVTLDRDRYVRTDRTPESKPARPPTTGR